MRIMSAGPVALFATLALPQPPAAAAVDHDLMPAPHTLEWRPGQLVVDSRFTAGLRGADDGRLAEALARFHARLGAQTGLRLAPLGKADPRSTVLVEAAAVSLPVRALGEDESYELVVDGNQARLTAPTTLGALHGLETLLQLVRQDGGRWVIPAVRIADRPRFPWRGLLIDPSRRWQPLESILRILDGMAAVKLNVLHWHLSEDQGFRVESRAFPRLHQQGSDGLFYTQEEVRKVIRAAHARGIRVVPEFDMPGHATSWLVGHPELGSAPGPFELVRIWGIFDNTLDPSRDEVYAFLDKFLVEMAGLFPDAYLHIGGDEVTPRQWTANAAIQDFMYEKNLSDANDLQAYFNLRVNEILTRHGKRMVGWDEILRPELPKNIVVQSWRGPKALARAAELGYDGLLSNGYYVDLNLSAESHYLPDPLPADSTLPAEARKHVLGGEACMWGELVSPENIDSRLWPRVAAVAERLWSPAELRDVDDMYRRLDVQSARLDRLGMKHLQNYRLMLERLAAGGPVEPLRTLADVVEPLKEYRRGRMRLNMQSMPLEKLVDTVRPESIPARNFRKGVDRLLLTPASSRDDSALRASLAAWVANHAKLEPVLAASPKAREARALSRELSAAAAVGLQALDAVRAGRAPAAAWVESAGQALDRAARPRIELELQIVPGLRKLVLAAARIEEAGTMPLEEWNRKLDEQLKGPAKPADEH